jgi:flavorubredoxin
MALELYNDGRHACLLFQNLVTGEAVQANQALILDRGEAALLDPGGGMTFAGLQSALSTFLGGDGPSYVVASHQDPDIISSLDLWLTQTTCKIVIPAVWERFIPHLTHPGRLADRVIPIPDQGHNLPLGNSQLQALPAHFLHAEGNFSFYDPISRILFSGDIGANFPHKGLNKPVTNLAEILPWLESFHRRYMSANKVCRYWVNMVRGLAVEKLVPQHGRIFEGTEVVREFLDWFAELECGIDLVTPALYKQPQVDA